MDAEHIFLVGDSAGAHLASLYAGICTGEKILNLEDSYTCESFIHPNEIKIGGLGLNCGIYNTLKADYNGLFGFRPLLKDLLGKLYGKLK